MYELPHELPNDLRLRILENEKFLRKSQNNIFLLIIEVLHEVTAKFNNSVRSRKAYKLRRVNFRENISYWTVVGGLFKETGN